MPYYNFERIPVVLNDPYHYGEPERVPVADLGAGLPAAGVTAATRRRRPPSSTRGHRYEPTAAQAAVTQPASCTETPEEVEYELRASEASMWTGSRLLIGVVSFAFASLAFAYFYLRSSDNEQLWRPHGVTAPTGIGHGHLRR